MTNIYVIMANDTFQLEERMEKFIAEKQIDAFNVSRYNFADVEPLEILNELQTISLLGDIKLVVVSNPELLKSSYSNDLIII